MNNWLKVLIKNVNWKKEILLVERLIGTEKRKQKYILVSGKSEKFWHIWHLVTIREFF